MRTVVNVLFAISTLFALNAYSGLPVSGVIWDGNGLFGPHCDLNWECQTWTPSIEFSASAVLSMQAGTVIQASGGTVYVESFEYPNFHYVKYVCTGLTLMVQQSESVDIGDVLFEGATNAVVSITYWRSDLEQTPTSLISAMQMNPWRISDYDEEFDGSNMIGSRGMIRVESWGGLIGVHFRHTLPGGAVSVVDIYLEDIKNWSCETSAYGCKYSNPTNGYPDYQYLYVQQGQGAPYEYTFVTSTPPGAEFDISSWVENSVGNAYYFDAAVANVASNFTGEILKGCAVLTWHSSLDCNEFVVRRINRDGSVSIISPENGLTRCTVFDCEVGLGLCQYELCQVSGNELFVLDEFSFSDSPNYEAIGIRGVYPNPVRSSTTFDLKLPPLGTYSVDVYDLRGRRVRNLGSGTNVEGIRSVIWDKTDDLGALVSAGQYYAVVRVNGLLVDSKKVIVLR